MVRLTIDNQNRLIFYDNPVGYVCGDGISAVVDEMFQRPELQKELERLRLTPQWRSGVYDQLISGSALITDTGEELKRCRVWQLRPNVDVGMRFIDHKTMVERFGAPTMDRYQLVYDGQLGTNDPEQVYTICRDVPPKDYCGHAMAMSDVVELYDRYGSSFYYCDRVGVQEISFCPQEQTSCMEMSL